MTLTLAVAAARRRERRRLGCGEVGGGAASFVLGFRVVGGAEWPLGLAGGLGCGCGSLCRPRGTSGCAHGVGSGGGGRILVMRMEVREGP